MSIYLDGTNIDRALTNLYLVTQLPVNEDIRDQLAHDLAKNVLNISNSTMLLLDDDHIVSYNILVRSIAESIIRLAWGIQTDEAANSLVESAHTDFRKNVTALVKDGVLSIEDPATGKNFNDDFLEKAQYDPKHRSKILRDMAKDLGLERFYQLLYKPLSMQTHGNYHIVAPDPPKLTKEARIKALLGGIESASVISAKWLTYHEPITQEELRKLLFPADSPNLSFKPTTLRRSALGFPLR